NDENYVVTLFNYHSIINCYPMNGVIDKKAKYHNNKLDRLIAKDFGISHGFFSLCKRVLANAPELHDPISAGTLTVQQAIRQLKAEGRWKTVREIRKANRSNESQ